MKKKTQMYSVWDNQTGNYMESGKNSKSLKEAIEAIWDWWVSGANLDDKDIKKMEKWNTKRKREMLESTGFQFHKHKEPIKEVDDW